MRTLVSAAIGAALVLAVTAQSPAPAVRKLPQQIRLMEQNKSDESGTATLFDGAKGLIVRLRLRGGESVDQPAHIHKGTCDKLDPKPAWALTTVHEGQSEKVIEGVTLAQLEKAPYAINVHKSTKEIPVYVACGNIVAPK